MSFKQLGALEEGMELCHALPCLRALAATATEHRSLSASERVKQSAR